VNIIGFLIIGIIYALAERSRIVSPEMRILLATGFCGGLITFSAFTYENIKLLDNGEFFYTASYVIASIGLGFLAVYFGILLIKLIF
jgi:CrcB protein